MGRYRRHLIVLAIVVVLIGAYAAAGFLAVPYFARKSLQEFVHQHYGRTLTIGKIRFNPFTLALDTTGFSLPDADGQPLLAFARLHVSLQLASLWRLGPSFREILLEQPYVRAVIRPDGALNLADLGKGFPSAPAKPQQKSQPMRLFIQRLAVTSGTTVFEDRTRPRPFHAELKPIAFELRDFSTSAGTGNAYVLNAASPEGERLIWSGTLRLTPLSSHGVFEIADLQARTLWRYLRESLPFEMDSGVIVIKGDYDLASGAGPLTLKLNVRSTAVTNLGLKPNGGAQRYIDLARIEVADTRLDLARHSVDIAKVQLSGGVIKAWMSEPGRLNLLELLAAPAGESAAVAASPSAAEGPPAAATASAAPATSSGPAWRVSAPDIALLGLKVSGEDRQVSPAAALLLDPLNVHVAGFNTSPDDTLDITLDSLVNTSGRINARAKVTPKSGALTAHIESADLGLPALQPYLAQYTSMTLLKGTLGAKLDIEREADGVLAVKGNTWISGLHTVDNVLKQDFINWKVLRIADIRYRSRPAGLRVGSVTALEPYARMVIAPDRRVNITEVLTPPGAAPRAAVTATAEPSPAPKDTAAARKPPAPAAPVQTAPAAGGAPTPFPVAIGAVRIANGSANYSDLWIKPSFAVGIQALAGTVTGLSSDPKSRAKVDLNGKVDRYSPAHIGGDINLLSGALYADVTMSFKDLDLAIVNPYSGHFAGYKIDKGKLSVDVSYKIEQRKLAAQQHFVVAQLQLGDQVDSPDAVHLPLKIAVALLKDRNGVIDINLPMSGSLDDPHFSIGPVIWKAFINLIVKAATAPFALLGHLFGGSEHMNIVEFAAGSAELEPPAKDQLASLVKALKERPQLKLDVPIVFSKRLDRPQMAAARLREALLARVQSTSAGKRHPDTAGEMTLADPEKHFHLLVDQYQADLGKDAQLPPSAMAVQAAKGKEAPYDPAIADLNAALIDHIEVPDADLEALGKQRAKAIQDALLSDGQVDPSRVFIVNATPKPDTGDKVKDTGDKVKDTADKVKDTGDKVKDPGDKVKDTGDKVKDTGDKVKVEMAVK
jgi:hypothetical protein